MLRNQAERRPNLAQDGSPGYACNQAQSPVGTTDFDCSRFLLLTFLRQLSQ
jgi:hypothetical protein